jgi:glycosyltransferase involved in cell wall biosynthesis
MRLSLFHPAFETIGGAEILAAEQANFFHREGHEVRLVTLAFDAGRWGARLPGIEVDLVKRRHWSDVFSAWSRVRKLRRRGMRAADCLRDAELVLAYNSPANAMLGVSRIKARKVWQCNEPPRGLHLKEANPALAARVAAGGPWTEDATRDFAAALARHEGEMARKRSRHAQWTFDLEGVRGLDLIYAISEFSRDNARRIYGRCREEVIYPIVRFPEGGRSRRGLDRSGLKVLAHSRLEVMKNIDTVIRGFCAFQKDHPGAELHVVGDGPHREKLEALAAELCPGAVRFHGYLPDAELRAVYEACDVLALLTLDEPFGRVYPEAAAKGLLLIGPDHGGPLEILDGGRLGWAVNAFDPQALAEALARVWSLDDAEVERRRAEADAACRSRFGWDAIGPQLRALLIKG